MAQREDHFGVVTDNEDPEFRGRVCVECPTIVSGDILEWVEPEFHFVDSEVTAGCMFVPNIGSDVIVSIESGRDAEVLGLETRWRCGIYPIGTVPEDFKEHYPHRRGWVTGEGHVLYFDDSGDDLVFYYKHPSGTTIKVTHEGNIELSPTTGQSVLVGSGADQHLVRGDVLESFLSNVNTWLSSHTHPVSGGTANASALPTPSIPADLLSDDHKVK